MHVAIIGSGKIGATLALAQTSGAS
jgi:malate/lactate dehydrogenase